MRALNWMRTLAAACALLSLLAATAIGFTDRPIDSPQGPPVPNPTEIGEPDTGSGGLPRYLRQAIAAAQLSHPGIRRLLLPLLRAQSRPVAPTSRLVRRR